MPSIAGGSSAYTCASRIAENAACARCATACADQSALRRSLKSFMRMKAMPTFCPEPPKP